MANHRRFYGKTAVEWCSCKFVLDDSSGRHYKSIILRGIGAPVENNIKYICAINRARGVTISDGLRCGKRETFCTLLYVIHNTFDNDGRGALEH